MPPMAAPEWEGVRTQGAGGRWCPGPGLGWGSVVGASSRRCRRKAGGQCRVCAPGCSAKGVGSVQHWGAARHV